MHKGIITSESAKTDSVVVTPLCLSLPYPGLSENKNVYFPFIQTRVAPILCHIHCGHHDPSVYLRLIILRSTKRETNALPCVTWRSCEKVVSLSVKLRLKFMALD